MKIYPPPEGLTNEQLRNGQWAIYADVKCTNPACAREYSAGQVDGIGGPCPRCGARCQ